MKKKTTKTTKTYKLFKLRKKDNTLSSLFINKKQILTIGKWLRAEKHPTKGFAVRPGWHTICSPNAPHLSMRGRVWYDVDIYDYEVITRPESQGGMWYISKWMRISRKVENR